MTDRMVRPGSASPDGASVDFDPLVGVDDAHREPETDAEAEERGPDRHWRFWKEQLDAAMAAEKRWRLEAAACEDVYFGTDREPNGDDPREALGRNQIGDKTSLIHGTISVLQPLVYSETPQVVVRRRFYGDAQPDPVDRISAEVAQRLCEYLLDTVDFDAAMEGARDDWLIAGRGSARVFYRETTALTAEGAQTAVDQRVEVRHVEWRRMLMPPGAWHQVPWVAYETPMSRAQVAKRFGEEVAEAMSFADAGLTKRDNWPASDDDDRYGVGGMGDLNTGESTKSPFATAPVWEIWCRERGEVIWWTESYKGGVIDTDEDLLDLDQFFPMPKPLLATTKGQQMTPRPDIRYYERRADEADEAARKLKSILKALSVSGFYPGKMQDEVNKILKGENVMVAIADWIGLMEKGGAQNVIQWLPLDTMLAAASALWQIREQAKAAMFEGSGVSDVMRAQGDPNATATQEQIKGRYAGLRMAERQKKAAIFARDLIRLMLEVAATFFSTKHLADISQIDGLAMSEAERQAIIQEVQQAQQALATIEAQMEQAAPMYEQAGLAPPQPDPTMIEQLQAAASQPVPEASWEMVHQRLRDDLQRKITIRVETNSTVLSDEQADKDARIEFLSAVSGMAQQLMPLVQSGAVPLKVFKELLLFGVRGFPKGRTLEGMIQALPDEPQGEEAPDVQVQVAQIRAETDRLIKEMDMADHAAEREHEAKMKGAEALIDMSKAAQQPAPGAVA